MTKKNNWKKKASHPDDRAHSTVMYTSCHWSIGRRRLIAAPNVHIAWLFFAVLCL